MKARKSALPKSSAKADVTPAVLVSVSRPSPAVASSCDVSDVDIVRQWMQAALDAVVAGEEHPPEAGRVYALVTAAMYEAAAGSLGMPSLGERTPVFPEAFDTPVYADWRVAMVRAAYEVLSGVLPESTDQAAELLERHLRHLADGIDGHTFYHSLLHGGRVSEAVLTWDATDGRRDLPADYTPPAGPGLWRPTPPGFAPALEPYWGTIRPMVLTSSDEVAAVPPVPFDCGAGEFYDQGLATYQALDEDGDERRAIATFWDSGITTITPSGHWLLIADRFLADLGADPADYLRAFMLTAVANHDAFIVCWKEKYLHNVLRPISYIHDHIDDTWEPHLVTPPFPEYVSGHSTCSGSASSVLTALYGDAYVTVPPGEPGADDRGYESFDEAAVECAASRVYGGVHYPMAGQGGLDAGRDVGALTIERLG